MARLTLTQSSPHNIHETAPEAVSASSSVRHAARVPMTCAIAPTPSIPSLLFNPPIHQPAAPPNLLLQNPAQQGIIAQASAIRTAPHLQVIHGSFLVYLDIEGLGMLKLKNGTWGSGMKEAACAIANAIDIQRIGLFRSLDLRDAMRLSAAMVLGRRSTG
ncbi:hypothetical protein CC78DRAFT_572198 [Lojkania enalia]|uniref:Uncharacterized protein n=1 Tax=Lojkania enalia TaxID=147567 RepID=A0A9P4N1P8_9PLEO|nr:hypothetical protein CC78DRAFT_572198 [Didymosphaeria enalia]